MVPARFPITVTARAVLVLGVGLLWAAEVHAGPLKERLFQARRQYVAQEYEQVIRLLTPMVQSPIATISEKVAAYELLGLSYLILGDKTRARAAFENLLGLDPGHLLSDPTGSPKLKRFYESVKESFVPGYQARAPVALEHAAPTRAVAGRKVELAVSIVSGRKQVRSLVLRWRRSGLLTYRTARMRGEGSKRVAHFILPEDRSSYRLEFYIEARSSAGHAVGRVGSPDDPLLVSVRGSERPVSKPIYQRWWFWTVIGVAVVGGVTAGIVAGTSDSAPTGTLEPDPIRLR